MPIDPNIALQVQAPSAPSQLDSLAKVLQIKNAVAQQPLIQQQIQAGQLENQQRQNDVNEYQGFKDALAKHGGDYEAATPDILAAAPKLGTGFIKTLTENKKNIAETTKANADAQKAQIEAADKQNSTISQALQGIDQVAPENRQNEYLNRLAILHASGVPTDKMPTQYDPQAVAGWIAKGTTIQQSIDAAKLNISQAEEARNARLGPDVAREKAAQADTAQAAATLATAKANLLKDPSSYAAQVDSLGLSSPAATRLKSQVGFYVSKGLIDEANRALDQGMQDANAPGKAAAVANAELPAKIAAETNPAVLQARTNQAVQTAKALREGDNPALSGVPPAAVAPATAAATKLDLDYGKAKASADAIQTVLNLAGSGNKAAGANAPLMGVGAVNAVNGLKRINSAEIAQYGTAGSLLDKIQGKLQGWTEGKPIPQDVLDDMQALHQQLRGSSYQQYTDGLNSINTRYGSKFGPTAPNPVTSNPVPPSLKSQFPNDAWARDPQGQLHHAPEGQALPQGWSAVN